MSEVIRDIHWTAHKNSWDQWANTHPPGSTNSPPPKLSSYFINKPNFKTEQVPHLRFSAIDLPEFMSAIGYPKQSSCHLDCIQIRLWIDVLAPIVTSALEHLSASLSICYVLQASKLGVISPCFEKPHLHAGLLFHYRTVFQLPPLCLKFLKTSHNSIIFPYAYEYEEFPSGFKEHIAKLL